MKKTRLSRKTALRSKRSRPPKQGAPRDGRRALRGHSGVRRARTRPIVAGTRGGSSRTPDRKSREKSLDRLCRQYVVLRDKGRCQKTGQTQNLQWAHIITRGQKSLRWNPVNSLMLTAGAHLWWHHQPLEAIAWFNEKFPERAKVLIMLRQDRSKKKIDLEATRLWLEQKIREHQPSE